jgi:hypothetical protein
VTTLFKIRLTNIDCLDTPVFAKMDLSCALAVLRAMPSSAAA